MVCVRKALVRITLLTLSPVELDEVTRLLGQVQIDPEIALSGARGGVPQTLR